MELQEVLGNAKNTTVIALDCSSTCTGYALAEIDWEKRSAVITKAGALWLPDGTHGEKYHYLQKCLEVYFYVCEKIDYLIFEQYPIPGRVMGALVVPELIGAVKAAVTEIGIKYQEVPQSHWRKALGIKSVPLRGKDGEIKTTAKGNAKRDWKTPVIDYFSKDIDFPEKVTSNISGKQRSFPNDIPDAMGVVKGWLLDLKGQDEQPFMKNVTVDKNIEFNSHIGYDFSGDM